MIIFKHPEDMDEFRDIDPRIMTILRRMEEIAWALEREPLTVTSIRRDDGSTHSAPAPYRFLDVGLFKRINNEWLRKWINGKFPYGKSGYVTIPPLRHGTSPHYHVQVRHK